MCTAWVREFDMAVTLQRGKRSAMKSASEPQPQPRSRTSMPSSRPARSQVSSSIASSAAARSSTPGRPQAAAVLESRSEKRLEEGGRQLVVLPVRGVLMDGERAGGERGGVPAQRRRVVVVGRGAEPLEQLGKPAADDTAKQAVGYVARGGRPARD